MRVPQFNLSLTTRNLAPRRHQETKYYKRKTKYYKKNDEIRRLLQTKPKDSFKSQFRSQFYPKISNPKPHKSIK